MKQIVSSNREKIKELFDCSIYANDHLGWIECWDLTEPFGKLFLDDNQKHQFLIALQYAGKSTVWLHSFYSTGTPVSYPLVNKLKKIMPPGRNSVYSISSHPWYSSLLERNGFKQADSIIQMETNNIARFTNAGPIPINDLEEVSNESIIQNCESAFPPVWRLNADELNLALETANYRKSIMENGKLIAYMLADISEDNCDIQRLAVSTEKQGAGYGSSLINNLISDCEKSGITQFSVNSNQKNEAAISFYRKLNFKAVENPFPVYYRSISASG